MFVKALRCLIVKRRSFRFWIVSMKSQRAFIVFWLPRKSGRLGLSLVLPCTCTGLFEILQALLNTVFHISLVIRYIQLSHLRYPRA